MSCGRILIVVNDLGYFISHRLAIAVEAQKCGYTVHVAHGSVCIETLKKCLPPDVRLHYIPMKRGSINPIRDILTIFSLLVLFNKLRPTLVHLITIKPVLYGGIAARLGSVPAVVSAMAGLGYVFVEKNGIKAHLIKRLVTPLFRAALGHPNQILIFQNEDDRDQIMRFARVSRSCVRLIYGSGVDLAKCPVRPEPQGIPIVAMASRLLLDKGVSEFVAAARILRERGILARFWLIGAPDLANPASLLPQQVAKFEALSTVECLGHVDDVPSLYSQANIIALPSYREGFPKSLIEAAACCRAVVTTDVPGCRDAIIPGKSGLLVPARDAHALAGAIESLINDIELRKAMGKAGRELAEAKFGIEKVVAEHLNIYRELSDG